MILVDTGPLVALFDPADNSHRRCLNTIQGIGEAPLVTTLAVLTEAFHLLEPNSRGAEELTNFIMEDYLSIEYLDDTALQRAFELMDQYHDRPMDFADASLIASAEKLKTRDVFTIDRNDFQTYRIRVGHRHQHVNIIQ